METGEFKPTGVWCISASKVWLAAVPVCRVYLDCRCISGSKVWLAECLPLLLL